MERDHNDLKIKFKKLHNLGAGKPTGTPQWLLLKLAREELLKILFRKKAAQLHAMSLIMTTQRVKRRMENMLRTILQERKKSKYSHCELNDSFDSTRDNNDEEDE